MRTEVNTQQNFNSNILLVPDSLKHDAVWGSELNLQSSLLINKPNWMAKASAVLDNWFYYPDSGLDMQNQYLDLQYAYLTERSRWQINGGYINDAILSSKANQIQGIVFGRVQRELFSIIPGWTYSVSEYTKVNLSYSYFNSKYPAILLSPASTDATYPNSVSNTLSSSVNNLYSEYLSFNSLLSATAFDTQTRKIDYINLFIGLKYSPSFDSEIALSIGGQYSQSTYQFYSIGQSYSQRIDQFSPLFDVSLTKKFENSSIILSYSQQSTPSINSNLFRSDLVSLSANHRLSNLFSTAFGFSYYQIETPKQAGSSLSQKSYQLNSNLTYNYSEKATISASYNFQARDIVATTGVFSEPQYAHIISLSLRYNFDELQF